LHANEVAILPYYVANLNIEATYAAITSEYEDFPNLCCVDTLDNVATLRATRTAKAVCSARSAWRTWHGSNARTHARSP
jgi:predicted helicase